MTRTESSASRRTRIIRGTLIIAIMGCISLATVARDAQSRYFTIQVIDESTGRGVPLVELETINHVCFVTDSNGLIAIDDPDLMQRRVFFTVRSHGYEYRKDGFGFRGKAFSIEAGGKATLKLKRVNIAERLYRTTGSGIYRDTILLGEKAPIEKPLSNADVFGCDSVMAAVYHGEIHWFWGDTSRPHYPIGGNFHITGATSRLPQDGGLDPRAGVNYHYIVGKDGAIRPTAEMPGSGPTWTSALTVLKDSKGRERMYAGYVKIRNQLESYQWGFVVWNDEAQRFEKVCSFDKKPTIFMEPQTHTLIHRENNGKDYVYFTNPLPLTRVRAEPAAYVDPEQYECFTCLKAGTKSADQQLDRDEQGRLHYSWKRGTPWLTQNDQAKLIKAGVMKPDEALIAVRDASSGRAVEVHYGSVYWNDYRRRWIMICAEQHGTTSLLGETWYAEADQLTGPWVYARKIVTHDHYTFYNPKHHPFFDRDNGKTIFFEGTYTHTFSGNARPTPRYDYNQIMYQLDLSNAALALPVAIYQMPAAAKAPPFAARQLDRSIAFFAMDRSIPDTVPVVWTGSALKIAEPNHDSTPLFHARAADSQIDASTTIPLYEFIEAQSGKRIYSTHREITLRNYRRSEKPVCRVWSAPTRNHAGK